MARGSCTAVGRMVRGGKSVREIEAARGAPKLHGYGADSKRGRKSVGGEAARWQQPSTADRPVVLGIQPKRPEWDIASKSREQTHTAVWVIWHCIARRCGRVSGLSLR